MKNQTQPKKPFVLQYEEAEKDIFNAVSKSAKVNGVPFYLLEGILTNLLHQVREQAKIERDNAERLYEKELEEYESAEKEAEEKETESEVDEE